MKIFFKISIFFTVLYFALTIFIPRVLAYDDLKVDEISVFPPAPMVNQYCQITVKIKNIGTRSLLTSQGLSVFNYKLNAFQQSNLEYQSPSLENMFVKDGYVTYKFSGKFTQATTTSLSFTINNTKELTEEKIGDGGFTVTLYDDDTLARSVTVYEPAVSDLGLESIALDRNFPIQNEPLNIIVTVVNNGPTTITSDEMINRNNIRAVYSNYNLQEYTYAKSKKSDYCLKATWLSSCNTYASFEDPLPVGGKIIYNYYGNYATKGEQTFEFTVNSNKIAPEASSTNNTYKLKFRVYESESDADNVAVSGVTVTNVSSTSINIIWQTDRKAVGQVITRMKNFFAPDEYSAATAFGLSHAVGLTGLTPNTKHWYQIKVTASTTPKLSDWQEINTLAADPAAAAAVNSSATANPTVTPPAAPATANPGAAALPALSTGAAAPVKINNKALFAKLAGKIILKVESKGEAYYLNPKDAMMYFLGRPDDAFAVMRRLGVGITNKNLNLLPIGLAKAAGTDSDGDGLPDMLEDAIGTDKMKADTDGDGHDDKKEISQGFNPKGAGMMKIDTTLANLNFGKIFLEVENKGEAWYINPADNKRYFLGRPADAFAVMRQLGVGISNKDFNNL